MADCVFCDTEATKSRMIANVDGFKIMATLGQITEGYVLLISNEHVPCIGAIDETNIKKVDVLSKKIRRIMRNEYRSAVTIFEHGIVGQTVKHAHLHFFPAYLNFRRRIQYDFPNTEVQTVESFTELSCLYAKRQEPYLLWSDDDSFSVCWNPPAKSMYLRIISAEMLDVPERADWKKMDPELDKAFIKVTIDRLTPLFSELY